MTIIGATGYFPKKNTYKKKVVKTPKGWGVWYSTPSTNHREVVIVYYKPRRVKK